MLPLLVAFAASDILIAKPSKYNIQLIDHSEIVVIDFDAKPEVNARRASLSGYSHCKHYMIISNPSDDLRINDEFIKTQIFEIQSPQSLFFYSENMTNIHIDIINIPTACFTLEFLINPVTGMTYQYNSDVKELSTTSNYCFVAFTEEVFDLEVKIDSPKVLQYSTYDMTSTTSLENYLREQFVSTNSVCFLFTPDSSRSSVTFTFTVSSKYTNLPNPKFLYDDLKVSYLTINAVTVGLKFAKYPILAYGVHSELINSTTKEFKVASNSYIVFTNWTGLSGTVHIGYSSLDILGYTGVVAILFNSTGTMELKSSLDSSEATFVVHSFKVTCNAIVTLSGKKSFKLELKGGSDYCMVSAFKSGVVEIEGSSNTLNKDYLYNYTRYSLEESTVPTFTIFNEIYIFGDAWVKYTIKPSKTDNSESYVLEGYSPPYSSYSISNRTYERLNTGKWETHKGLSTFEIFVIVFFALVALIVIAILIGICIYKIRQKTRNLLNQSIPLEDNVTEQPLNTVTTTRNNYQNEEKNQQELEPPSLPPQQIYAAPPEQQPYYVPPIYQPPQQSNPYQPPPSDYQNPYE